ncbi:hypothetical protein SESBI_05483 [Sesbania bispinosa]|nr:hypothetical protein SESBI_05483 [Sesbania bispinosa]
MEKGMKDGSPRKDFISSQNSSARISSSLGPSKPESRIASNVSENVLYQAANNTNVHAAADRFKKLKNLLEL